MFREPRARFLSAFRYFSWIQEERREKEGKPRVKKHSLSLWHRVFGPQSELERWAAYGARDDARRRIPPASQPNAYMNWLQPEYPRTGEQPEFTRQHVADALKFLAGPDMRLVLLTERYHESVLLMKHIYGLPSAHYIPHKVQAKAGRPYEHFDDLSARSRRVVREATRWDAEVYKAATIVFEMQIDCYGRERMARDLAEFEKVQRHLDSQCEEDAFGTGGTCA